MRVGSVEINDNDISREDAPAQTRTKLFACHLYFVEDFTQIRRLTHLRPTRELIQRNEAKKID